MRVLLLLVSAYLLATLIPAIARTGLYEQDAAYYCEVAERWAHGDGLTSLSDRRGPASARAFPQPFDARSHWPVVLGVLVEVTGNAAATATVLSLLALLGSLWLGALALRTGLRVDPITSVACVAIALGHREALQSAISPYADSVSLFLNVAFLAAAMRHRVLLAVLALGLAVLVRHQNVVLLVTLPSVLRLRGQGLAILGLLGVAVWLGGGRLLEGLGVAFDPNHRDSLPRGLRLLFVPLLLGLPFALRELPTRICALAALGHFVALLSYPDSSDERQWLFAARHALPLHFVAAAFAGVVLTRARGWTLPVTLAAVALAAVDHVLRPVKLLRARAETTARADLVPMVDWLAARPLPDGSIVLAHDADVLAHRLHLRAVHTRGFDPADGPALRRQIEERGITHVLLTWQDKPVMASRNREMDALARSLAPCARVVHETRGDRARAMLFEIRR